MQLSDVVLREISLNEFPQWSPWPARLLGLAEWNVPNRTVEKIDKEYDKDKYLRCLEYVKTQKGPQTPETVRDFEFQFLTKKSMCISSRGKLYEIPTEYMSPYDNHLLSEVMEPLMKNADTVVEIGCGYGINLWHLAKRFPDKTYRGGEYSPNAVELANILYKDYPRISVEGCNFYDDAYRVLDACKGKRVILVTRHAIEQLPTAAKVFQTLTQYFDRLVYGVHLDVVFENFGDTLLDLLRKRYVLANDYNRDLLSLLKNHKNIDIIRNDSDVYGGNPLNPTSIVIWKPR